MNLTPPSTQAVPGFFAGTNGLDPSAKLPFMPPNFNGKIRVDACKGINPRAGGKAFIVEMTVLESNLAHLQPNDPAYVAVGSKRCWYQKIPLTDSQTAYGACIAFLYAALGVVSGRDQVKIDTEIKPQQDYYLNLAVSAENPLAGTDLGLQTSNIKTKGKNEDFTLHTFSPLAQAAA